MRLRILVAALMSLIAMLFVTSTRVTAQTPDPVWSGQYYNNATLSEPPAFTRTDGDISFNWGMGSPGSSITDDAFSVRWSTDIFLNAGTYRFWVYADDNVSITVDFRNKIIDTFDTDQVDQLVAADIELGTGSHHIQVDYREIDNRAFAYVDFANLADNPSGPDFAIPNGRWTAQYYANTSLSGTPSVIRSEGQPGANWGAGSPAPSIPEDNWSARWNTTVNLENADYQIRTTADDGVRVYIDGIPVINEWHLASGTEYVASRPLASGNHTITVEFYEAGGTAFLAFSFDRINDLNGSGTVTATVTAGRLNVRGTPDPINGDILTQVNYAETYVALTRTADYSWVKINVNGIIGWVNARYVDVSDIFGLPVEDTSTQPQATGYIVTATPYTVNIRTGPGTRFDDIGNFPAQQTASVIGRNTNATWWQINYGDVVGWVSAQYAIIEDGADLSQIPITE